MRYLALAALWFVLAIGPAQAQSEDNGTIVSFIEEQLSTDNRQIRLSGIEGLLASDARVGSITISDKQGTWLEIHEAEIVWSRLALLRGRLSIDSLRAKRIALIRSPLPDPSLPVPEAQPFAIPELPLSVEIGEISVEQAEIGREFLGEPAELSLTGKLALAGGNLDADIVLLRLDEGGEIRLNTAYTAENTSFSIDLSVKEPKGGLMSRLLKIKGEPALDLQVTGAGPITDLDVSLALEADGARRLTGTTVLRETPTGIGFDADLTGRIDLLMPEDINPFFAGESRLTATGEVPEAGGLLLDALDLKTAAMELKGRLATTPDGFLRHAAFDGVLQSADGPTVLPVPGGLTSLGRAALRLDFGNDPTGAWSGDLTVQDFAADDLSIAETSLALSGMAKDLEDPARRSVSLDTKGTMGGFRAATPDLTRALGQQIDLDIATRWKAGDPLEIETARLAGNGILLDLAGSVAEMAFDGTIRAVVARLAPFGGLAGRDLRGALDLRMDGQIAPLDGSFALNMQGKSTSLKLDMAQIDPLLTGQTIISGRIERDSDGFRTRNLTLRNRQIDIFSDGVISTSFADLEFRARLADLADLTLNGAGAVTLTGSAKGADGDFALTTRLQIADGKLMQRDLTGFDAGFRARLRDGVLIGRVAGEGSLEGDPIALRGDVTVDESGQSARNLEFSVGPSAFTGALSRHADDGLFEGSLALVSSDISALAALALQEANGAIRARISLDRTETGQQVTLKGNIKSIRYGDITVSDGLVDGAIQNALGVPAITGDVIVTKMQAFGVGVASLTARAKQDGPGTSLAIRTALENGAVLEVGGSLTELAEGYTADLERLDLTQGQKLVSLARSAGIEVTGDVVRINALDLSIGAGNLRISGEIADAFDLALDARDIPLEVANAIRPDLGISGALNGQAGVSGPRSNPAFAFDIDAKDVSSDVIRDAGLPPVSVYARGKTEAGNLQLNAKVEGPGQFNATAEGNLPLGAGPIDITGKLNDFPLALVARIAGDPGLRGAVSGDFGVAGTTRRPRIRFNIGGRDITATAMRNNGVPPVTIDAEGSFGDDKIILPSVVVGGGGGLDFRLSGRVPLRLDGLDVGVRGTVPLSVAQVILARSGTRAEGIAEMSFTAKGSLSAPDLQGTVAVSGGSFVAPLMNFRLNDVNIKAGLDGDRLTIQSAQARNSTGGNLSVSGTIEVAPRRGIPVKLAAALRNVSYTNGTNATAQFSGDLTLTGPITRRAKLAGQVNVDTLEFAIPEKLGSAASYQLDVRHVRASPRIRQTLARAEQTGRSGGRSEPKASWALDVSVNAPSRVFVRGRGLDAELGGQVRVTGTLSDFRPTGQFSLIRGRFSILGQRVDLSAGEITLSGDLNPDLLLRARTIINDVEATIGLEGPASSPELALSSVPDLPDDEILALVVFRRALSDLSPLQVARLAAALGELSGRTGPSFFESVRAATGLDDLDFEQAEDGTTTVRAGKYLRDNIYSVVEADDAGNSKATINLDISRDFTGRASVGSDGNTSFGIFFEKDY